jgi:adenylate kinase
MAKKNKNVLILIGPPGSGKGTQAEDLCKIFQLESISPGLIFRNAVTKKTKLGKLAKPYLQKGLLVPDDVVSKVVFKKIKQAKSDILLDGFPRNLKQANLLKDFFAVSENDYKVVVLEIDLSAKEILERITGRRACDCGINYHLKFKPPQQKGICDKCRKKLKIRSDSSPQVVKTRIKVYNDDTQPIIRFYKRAKDCRYRKIDGADSIDKVRKNIVRILKQQNVVTKK